ncbi:MAG: DUF3299 domain-containing protein [Anaerolineae bacterium]
MINSIKQTAYLNRFTPFIFIGGIAFLFGCSAPPLPISEAELNSALQVTPASPIISATATAPAPTALPSQAEAEAAIEAIAENSTSGYPAPTGSESAVVSPEEIVDNTQGLSYPAPEQVLQDSPVVPTVSVVDLANNDNSSENDAAQEENKPEPVLGLLQADGSIELGWSDLIPADFTPDSIYQKYQEQLAEIPAGDPKIQELQAQMQEEFNNAPANEALNGKLVRVPGFITPLDYVDDMVTEFLLVPYFGACIHVPAPPVNQTVFVTTNADDGISLENTFSPIWVVGVLQTESTSTELATAGYTIQNATIEFYNNQE